MEEQHALRRLPVDVVSPGEARRFTLATLGQWNLSHLGDVAQLLVSELVTNSVRYGDDPCLLELTHTADDRLVVKVSDGGEGRPERQDAAPEDFGGRGLAIVETLADRWGVGPRTDGRGKAVWFELAAGGVTPSRA